MSEEAVHIFISENIILLCVVLLIAFNIGHFLEIFQIFWLPASGAQMILGFIIGIIIFYSSAEEVKLLDFNSNIFFFMFIPPIVYEAGYSMKRINFFQNIGSIALFAFVGTFISSLVVGCGIFWLGRHGILPVSSNPHDSLIFGALISSTDPIATLAILGSKTLRCDPVLYSLIFGESVLNDAVAIVLYQSLLESRTTELSWAQLGNAFFRFCYVFAGSVIIGMAVAMLSAFILRRVNYTSNPSIETVFMFVTAYGCYCLAEVCSLSGLMALFMCGVSQAHYAWYNISAVSRIITRHVYHSFSHVSESLLFVHLGICFFFSTQSSLGYQWNLPLVLCSFGLCLVGRALNIFPMAAIANLGRKSPITWKMQVVMWFSGLRGAIAFALAASLEMPEFKVFITTTMAIIVFTTIVMGGSCHGLLQLLGMAGEDPPLSTTAVAQATSDDSSHNLQQLSRGRAASSFHGLVSDAERFRGSFYGQYLSQNTPAAAGPVFYPETVTQHKRLCPSINLRRSWVWFDQHYLQPYFGGRHALQVEDFSAESHHFFDTMQEMPNPYLKQELQVRFDLENGDDDDDDDGYDRDDIVAQSQLSSLEVDHHDVEMASSNSMPVVPEGDDGVVTAHDVENDDVVSIQHTSVPSDIANALSPSRLVRQLSLPRSSAHVRHSPSSSSEDDDGDASNPRRHLSVHFNLTPSVLNQPKQPFRQSSLVFETPPALDKPLPKHSGFHIPRHHQTDYTPHLDNSNIIPGNAAPLSRSPLAISSSEMIIPPSVIPEADIDSSDANNSGSSNSPSA